MPGHFSCSPKATQTQALRRRHPLAHASWGPLCFPRPRRRMTTAQAFPLRYKKDRAELGRRS